MERAPGWVQGFVRQPGLDSIFRCAGYLDYVVDTRVGDRVSVADVPVFREFTNVFPEELLGVPPKRQVEFRSVRVPCAAPIVKTPYRLAPLEMQELSS